MSQWQSGCSSSSVSCNRDNRAIMSLFPQLSQSHLSDQSSAGSGKCFSLCLVCLLAAINGRSWVCLETHFFTVSPLKVFTGTSLPPCCLLPHLCLLAKLWLNLLNMHNKHAGRKPWGAEEVRGQICDPHVQKRGVLPRPAKKHGAGAWAAPSSCLHESWLGQRPESWTLFKLIAGSSKTDPPLLCIFVFRLRNF